MLDERFALLIMRSNPYVQVQRLRMRAEDVEPVVAEVRARMRERGKRIASWWVSERSTPDDLEQRLLEAGLQIDPDDYDIAGLATTEPPPVSEGVEVVRADDLETFRQAAEVQWEVFGKPQEEREHELALLPDDFEEQQSAGSHSVFLARIDGRPAGAAGSAYSPRGALLWGGATAEWARGRGVYRALVRARWDDAVARGTPTLAVGAGAMSKPILLRLGFRELCRFRRVGDSLDY